MSRIRHFANSRIVIIAGGSELLKQFFMRLGRVNATSGRKFNLELYSSRLLSFHSPHLSCLETVGLTICVVERGAQNEAQRLADCRKVNL